MKNHLLRLTRSLVRISSRRIAACLVLAGGMSLAAKAVDAAPVSYQFSGVVNVADPSSGVAVGTSFSGTFAYDPNNVSNTSSNAGFNDYIFSPQSPDFSPLTLNVGGKPVFIGNDLGIQVYDRMVASGPAGSPASSVEVISNDPSSDAAQLHLVFNNTAVSLDPSHSLPTLLSLQDYPQASLLLTTQRPVQSSNPIPDPPLFGGTITSLTPVPEPSVLALPALLAIGLGARRFRRRRCPSGR